MLSRVERGEAQLDVFQARCLEAALGLESGALWRILDAAWEKMRPLAEKAVALRVWSGLAVWAVETTLAEAAGSDLEHVD